MNKPDAGKVLATMAAAFRTELAEDNAEVWFHSALAAIDAQLGMAVAARIVAQDKWFPSPARFNEIRRQIERSQEPETKALPAGDSERANAETARYWLERSRELLKRVDA